MVRPSRSTYVVLAVIAFSSLLVGAIMAISTDRWLTLPFSLVVGLVLCFLYWVIDRFDLG